MNPREIVFEQIHHRETIPVPYTLAFEPEIKARLDEHYGGEDWRERIVPYVAQCGSVIASGIETIDDAHYRDAFGTVWRTDRLPPVVVEPGLKAPSFEGYDFPSMDTFLDPNVKAEVKQRVADSPDAFTIVSAQLCLWESWYVRGFEQTMMDCALKEGFYTELLDRMTALCLGWIKACADIPADGIMMGDDWGDQRGVLIGPERWKKFYKPRYARIFEAIHDQGKVAILHAATGTLVPLLLVGLLTRVYGKNKSFAEGLRVWKFAIFSALAMTVPYVIVAHVLGPEQVRVLAISEKTNEYAEIVETKLRNANLRCSFDISDEKIGAKIAKAHADKLPYMLIVGPKEAAAETVNVRMRGVKENITCEIDKFLEEVRRKIADKEIDLTISG